MTQIMIPTLADALAKRGYETLTPVQDAVTKPELEDADLLVSAQTGSGKTVGFGLAIAPTLLGGAERFGPAVSPLALIIAPTRELALQVKRELAWLYEAAGVSMASCVGGMDMRDERRALDRGAHIVVGTPGRLKDHIQRGSLDLGMIRAVVLDEADEMLDLGFREDLEFILGAAPESRRTLMFSATVPKTIAALAKSFQKDAVRVTTAGERSQHADIEYRAMQVAPSDAENAIVNVLRFYEAQNAIVFCNTRIAVNRLVTRLSNRSFSVVALSGELSQNERTHALQAMRDGRARVCVATDVAARGIDLPNLELVIHADLPTNADTLLHRSGRTGRAGRKGVSAMIVTRNARKKAESLLRFAKVNAEWGDAPSVDAVERRDAERLLEDPVWSEAATENESNFAAELLKLYKPEQIAAAYVRLYKGNRSAPEEIAAGGGNDGGARPAFGPSQWFSVSVGRAQNAEPRWLLPMLCRSGNISREDVGAIRVQETETYVEVLQSSAARLLAAVGSGGKLEGDAVLTALSKPPFGERVPQAAPPAPDYKSKRKHIPGAKKAFEKKPYAPREDRPLEHKMRDERPHVDKRPFEKPQFDKPRPDSPQNPNKPDRAERKPRHIPRQVAAEHGLLSEPAVRDTADKPQGTKPGGKTHRKGASAATPNPGVAKYKPGKAKGAAGGNKGWAAKKPAGGKPKAAKGGSAVPRRPKA
jgi:ATP-dependent RNA helicase DeaD